VVFEERLSQLDWVETITASRQNLLQKSNPEYTFELKLKQTGAVATDNEQEL
jgi:hypothetical protein